MFVPFGNSAKSPRKKSKIQLGEKEKECGCGGIKCAEVNQEVEVEVTQECRVNL